MATKEEYIDALSCVEDVYRNKNTSMKAIHDFEVSLYLLKELVNEHFEEKQQETNFEHYKDEIRNTNFDFAVRGGEVIPCDGCPCGKCLFSNDELRCREFKIKWLYKQYEKKYKLTQFEYDLISTYDGCHEACKFSDCRQLRGLKEKGYFKSVDANTPVHEILDNCEVIK